MKDDSEDVEVPFEPIECAYSRPPGALPEASFLLRCTRCDLCIAACNRQHLKRHPDDGSPRAGTPVLTVNEAACGLCADQPCSAACATGALLRREPREVTLGLAWVERDRCLAWQGQPCDLCASVCPVQALHFEGGAPVIDESACTGCGNCRAACPLTPPAIVVLT